jgi:drug/metabolite transporter (DMT)-like permease
MQILPVMALILVSAFWGIHAVVGKAIESQLGPFELTLLRYTFGAVIFTPFIPRIIRLARRNLWQLGLTGLFWAVLYPVFFYQSLRFITPVESLLFINTSPLIAALLGWLFLGEGIRLKHGIGIGTAFLGIAWTSVGQWKTTGSFTGILFMLIAAAAFAAYTVSSRSLTKKLPLFDMVAATSIFGAIELWIIAILGGRAGSAFSELSHLNFQGWEAFLYIVIIVSTASYFLYGYGLQKVTSAVSSALTFYPQVVFAGLVQWIWLRIEPTWTTFFSTILILGGVLIMQFPDRKR